MPHCINYSSNIQQHDASARTPNRLSSQCPHIVSTAYIPYDDHDRIYIINCEAAWAELIRLNVREYMHHAKMYSGWIHAEYRSHTVYLMGRDDTPGIQTHHQPVSTTTPALLVDA